MREIRYLQALREAISQEMTRDESIFVMGEDVRHSLRGATKDLVQRFGEQRVVDTPISEAAFTGMATGAAMAGLRPIVEYQISALIYVSFDQLINQAQKLPYMMGGQGSVPVTYMVTGSGARSGLAGQHSDHPYPFLVHAGMKTIVPSTPYDMKGLMISAIRDNDPVMVFAPAKVLAMKGQVPEEAYAIPFGQADIKRKGDHITVAAVGHLVHDALKAANELALEGISVEVFDPRTLLPFDKATLLESVAKTGRLVVFDDSNRTCGFAAEVASIVAEEGFSALKAPIKRVTRADVPVPFNLGMESFVIPTKEDLIRAIRQIAQEG
ncbi:alpha-ketoacid dehydrogenase subunit beta [Paenibacillus eucommiae]|uniref:Pyruvate dehydrogenase E1 component beta subunit n=1 Tax=Paenibacillus eucommiae TaxID=1355755 RepID=A0ABS4J3Y9_9BACL|nr:transketolase C-terminal domain-containing protein [Paenibacillus eucommiae]MBP1994000.1 pyruvate dehydrogenase E1 component beta subunit [Paenibacillus eucommiae]